MKTPNPDWVDAPYEVVTMTEHGVFRFHENKGWYKSVNGRWVKYKGKLAPNHLVPFPFKPDENT